MYMNVWVVIRRCTIMRSCVALIKTSFTTLKFSRASTFWSTPPLNPLLYPLFCFFFFFSQKKKLLRVLLRPPRNYSTFFTYRPWALASSMPAHFSWHEKKKNRRLFISLVSCSIFFHFSSALEFYFEVQETKGSMIATRIDIMQRGGRTFFIHMHEGALKRENFCGRYPIFEKNLVLCHRIFGENEIRDDDSEWAVMEVFHRSFFSNNWTSNFEGWTSGLEFLNFCDKKIEWRYFII